MKKILILLLFTPFLGGCNAIFNQVFDEIYQNIEIDHFELVSDDRIEFLVNSEEDIDFKDYINRISSEGEIKDHVGFACDDLDFDITEIGEYDIVYYFTSFEESVEYTLTVYVVEELTKSE